MSNTILFEAIQAGDLELVKSLVKKGVSIHSKNKKGETPLHIAVYTENLNIVKWLIEKGADLNARVSGHDEGSTALHYAIQCNKHLEIAKFLIGQGADASLWDSTAQSPLSMAIDNLGEEKAASLFKENQDASLYFAISKKDLEAGENLIKAGADVHSTDDKSNTLLHLAVQKGDLNLVRLCIEKGANINSKNNLRKSPLDYAKNKQIKNFLQAEGAKKSSFLDKLKGRAWWLLASLMIYILMEIVGYGFVYFFKNLIEKIVSWF